VRNRLNLFIGDPKASGGLAVLRKDELAGLGVAGTHDAQFPDLAIELTDTFIGEHTEHTEVSGGMIKYIGYQRKDCPPVARGAGGCAWFGYRVLSVEKRGIVFFYVVGGIL
ncbi:uncharacterized protein METZ01_LOCUS264114, partial [marine metagenome]